MKKILITGPESSGKSYLSSKLSAYFNGLLVEEYAREFFENKKGYTAPDLLTIAKKQSEIEMRAVSSKPNFLFCDTGIEVISIWSKVKYNKVDPQITSLLQLASYDLILLCKPNIPWQFDELREHPENREQLFTLYTEFLIKNEMAFKVIDQSLQNRVAQAVSYVSAII